MNAHKIKNIISNILLEDENFCLLLDGGWGTGKTHLYKSVENDVLKDKDVKYISLFGISSIEEIKSSLILRLLPDKYFDKISNEKTNFFAKGAKVLLEKYTGVSLESILNSFSVEDVCELIENPHKIVICFDDFERTTDNINLKELLGLIEKVSKYFKIIIISNTEELAQNQKKIFLKYHEKIIDNSLKLDEIDSNILTEISSDFSIDCRESAIDTYLTGNKIYSNKTENKRQYETSKIHNLRIFKKYIWLISKLEKKFDKNWKLDKTILGLCKDVVYYSTCA